MRRLSKQKRDQLILILLLTVGGVCGIYLGFIKDQRATLESMPAVITDAQTRLDTMRKAIKESSSIESDLKTAHEQLAVIESGMATGDLNAWFYSTIKEYRKNFPVDVPQLSKPDEGECMLLPHFPYKRAKAVIGGTAYFHDFGKFLSHFENDFPYFQVQNVVIGQDAASGPGEPNERERLSFHMDIVALIKPGSS